MLLIIDVKIVAVEGEGRQLEWPGVTVQSQTGSADWNAEALTRQRIVRRHHGRQRRHGQGRHGQHRSDGQGTGSRYTGVQVRAAFGLVIPLRQESKKKTNDPPKSERVHNKGLPGLIHKRVIRRTVVSILGRVGCSEFRRFVGVTEARMPLS